MVEVMNELDRYERQERIWGKKGQERIAKSRVAIIGSDHFAQYTAMPLAALGVGEIVLIGSGNNHSGRFLDVPFQNHGMPTVEGVAAALKHINPQIEIVGIPAEMDSPLMGYFLDGADVIVDATNDLDSKLLTHDIANSRHVFSGSIDAGYARLTLRSPGELVQPHHVVPVEQGAPQDPLISLLWGGIVAEEAKKVILGDEDVLSQSLYYRFGAPQRFDFRRQDDATIPVDYSPFKDLSALAVGAGALGNIFTIAFSHMGMGSVTFVDDDEVKSHNLNRQILFHDAIGKKKADVLAQKYAAMSGAHATAQVKRLKVQDGAYSIDNGFDLGFDLVDNLYARALFSAYAVQHGIPLVSAASSSEAAQAALYAPDVTACLNHVFSNYYDDAVQQERVRRQSCIDQPDPSVIVTNQVAGALAALETCALYAQGGPFNGSLKYDSRLPFRLGTNMIKTACDCHYHPEQLPDLEIRDLPELP